VEKKNTVNSTQLNKLMKKISDKGAFGLPLPAPSFVLIEELRRVPQKRKEKIPRKKSEAKPNKLRRRKKEEIEGHLGLRKKPNPLQTFLELGTGPRKK